MSKQNWRQTNQIFACNLPFTFRHLRFVVLGYKLEKVKMPLNKFSLIAAACENMGIGIKGSLPWRLR